MFVLTYLAGTNIGNSEMRVYILFGLGAIKSLLNFKGHCRLAGIERLGIYVGNKWTSKTVRAEFRSKMPVITLGYCKTLHTSSIIIASQQDYRVCTIT